ncbi:MAG TPA: group I intron-associated PD-(D/E)XK endonuclease [Candidatus Hydrogenedentes bacterium]|nr:group I intron-associated PD-(D/E)XK endonuclease [Candidatus Hydrogenedentota bacterium]HOH51537.1 group I intron-associated PD-(D/E)XK endonuclease [Candidatus Hydrogenedentota bacterium]
MKVTTKMLGDAGEHYALSQFTLHGCPAAKMPGNWEGYDLAVESGGGLQRVSVKTRNKTAKWNKAPWFSFDDRKKCDWLVFILIQEDVSISSWVVPFKQAEENANKPGRNRKDRWNRDLSLKKLNESPLKEFKNNWQMSTQPANDANS